MRKRMISNLASLVSGEGYSGFIAGADPARHRDRKILDTIIRSGALLALGKCTYSIYHIY